MEEPKNKRGGARQGAGRKKIEGRDVAVAYRISATAKEKLAAWAASRGISVQEAVNRLFEALE